MISVYCDGSSTGRAHGPGGFGWVICLDGKVLLYGSGFNVDTTNNRMELMGAIVGLQAARHQFATFLQTQPLEIVSDSQYVLGLMTGGYTPTTNLELARHLRKLFTAGGSRYRARWVKGHSGDKFNEVCDKLAKKGKAHALEVITRGPDSERNDDLDLCQLWSDSGDEE